MKYMSVKTYAEMVDKSDKTIYKQIKKGSLEAVRVKKGYQVCVDANMLKRLTKMEKALAEAKEELNALQEEKDETRQKTSVPKKKVSKKSDKKTPLKKHK
jgi:excisionase family DNA binding protein